MVGERPRCGAVDVVSSCEVDVDGVFAFWRGHRLVRVVIGFYSRPRESLVSCCRKAW